MDFWTPIGVIITVLIALRFISQLGKSLPILELMLLIAAAQWIMGPLIEYNLPNLHYKYFMYVDQQQYMSYVVPAFGAFAIAVYLGLGYTKTTFIGIEKLGANEVSSFIFLVPFSAITLSIIFLKEEVHFTIFVGTILTLFAVKVLNNIKIFKKKNTTKM